MATLPVRTCRHCDERRAGRARGLCWRCYLDPQTRGLYPADPRAVPSSVRDYNGGSAPPPQLTSALPGSPEKVAELAKRALLGMSLWHPDDVQPEE